MARILLILIPLLTFIIPVRWFGYYATLLLTLIAAQLVLLVALSDQSKEAYASFGIGIVVGYLLLNSALLAVRYLLIKRARARIIKLPAPDK